MRPFLFYAWQKLIRVFISVVMLAGMIVQPVTAQENDKSWFKVKTVKVTERVCVGRNVTLQYTAWFDGIGYCKDKKCGKYGPLAVNGPAINITSIANGIITEYNPTLRGKDIDGGWAMWEIKHVIFKPTRAGKAIVDLKANFMDVNASDQWEFNIMDPCPMDIEIHADQTSLKGKPVEKAKEVWKFRIWWEGYAKIISRPLEQESGSGGNNLPAFSELFTTQKEDATGTLDYFADAIFIGQGEGVTCWTEGALTCSHQFTVHPVLNDETIDFQFDIASGQCSGFTVVCKGPNGGGRGSIPPSTGGAREMNAVISREGGSTHFIRELPYGMSVDYLISAFPVEE